MADYPDDCIQSLTSSWWEEDTSKVIARGSVVWTYVQFFSEVPLELASKRVDSDRHDTAILTARPLYASGRRSNHEDLPVAALPRLAGADCYIVNRAKRRPCLVLGGINRREVERRLTSGMINSATHEFLMVAPYFSVGQEGKSGYNPAFVERIKHAEYSRFFWELLPGDWGHESILRFDLMQPVGFHHQAFEHTGFRLSDEALRLTDEWLGWVLYDRDGTDIREYRKIVADFSSGA